MKRIDFLGAPGVGKTTIYKNLLKQRKRSDKWFTPREIKIQYGKNLLWEEGEYFKLLFLKTKNSKNIANSIAEQYIEKKGKDILWKEKNKFEDFWELIIKGVASGKKHPLRKLMGVNYFYLTMRDLVFFLSLEIENQILFDESLSQKIYGIADWEIGAFEKTTEDYFKKMPLPDSLIFFWVNTEDLLERIKSRGKIIPGHREMGENEIQKVILAQQHIASLGKDVLKSRGVNVIEINTNDKVEKNTKIINDMLRQ